jgi:hypothetical protein
MANRIEQQALVEQLSRDTLAAIDAMQRDSRFVADLKFVVYVGHKELMAIRYINDPLYYQTKWPEETFMGCCLFGVKEDSHFHVAKNEFMRS